VPFTPAHVAAVLPLVGKGRPKWAFPSALVIGSLVPDLLYFVPIRSDRNLSHSLTGVVTLDLALGLLFLALWRFVAAPVVRDLSPGRIRSKIPVPPPSTVREALWAVPCVVLGALTHVVWDSFTHANGWVVQRVPFLTEEFGLPIFELAQYGSGLFGCALVLAYCLRSPDAPLTSDDAPRATERERVAALALLAALPVVCALAFALPAWLVGTQTEIVLYIAVVRGVSGLGLVACAVAVWWHLTVRRRAAVLAAGGEEAAAGADRDPSV
jgi:hypothetical protein